MSQGYLFIALGKRYIEECFLLSNTIRKTGDNRPISLLVYEEDIDFANKFNTFDQYVKFNPQDNLWKECATGFEKFCLYPRLYFPDYLIYDETIIVDSDVLCQYNPEHVWEHMTNQNLPVRMLGRKNDPNWHWGHINKVSQAYGKHVPHVHGGFFYIRKDAFTNDFFNYTKEVFYKYDEFNCLRAFRGGRVDEIIFAICHANFNLMPLEFDEYPVMTFNYEPNEEIPSKKQTEGGQNIQLNNFIPFVHMFDKMEGQNFRILYEKIMRNNYD
jgi:hypothetical protein